MLNISNLSLNRGSSTVLQSVSLRLSPSAVHAIVGLNGSGKTSLLKALAGLWPIQSGSIQVMDENVARWNRQQWSRTFSLVPQAATVPFNYRVADIVAMGSYPLEGASTDVTVESALEAVDLLHLKERSILQVSAGERQRAYIARALITQAPILLLDEPTANLDLKHQAELWMLLEQLAHQGHLVVVATHHLAAASRYAQSVTLLDEGKLLEHGTAADILHSKELQQLFGLSVAEHHPFPLS